MKVTDPPLHIEVEEALMVTEGVTELVVIVITLLFTVGVVGQLMFEVIVTLTTSFVFNVDVVKDEPVAPPTFASLTCH